MDTIPPSNRAQVIVELDRNDMPLRAGPMVTLQDSLVQLSAANAARLGQELTGGFRSAKDACDGTEGCGWTAAGVCGRTVPVGATAGKDPIQCAASAVGGSSTVSLENDALDRFGRKKLGTPLVVHLLQTTIVATLEKWPARSTIDLSRTVSASGKDEWWSVKQNFPEVDTADESSGDCNGLRTELAGLGGEKFFMFVVTDPLPTTLFFTFVASLGGTLGLYLGIVWVVAKMLQNMTRSISR
jgi:hypothetical protein